MIKPYILIFYNIRLLVWYVLYINQVNILFLLTFDYIIHYFSIEKYFRKINR